MHLHQATLDHLDQLVSLFDAYRQFYAQPSDLAGAKTFLANRIAHGESVIFIAYLEDKAVGFTQLYPSFSSVSMKRVWVLNDLFVAPEARRKGVADALMQRAEQFATDTHAKGLALETALDNTSAQSLYERRNWTRGTDFYTYFFKI